MVDCISNAMMRVELKAEGFDGMMRISDLETMNCSVFAAGAKKTVELKVPFDSCNTYEIKTGHFLNHLLVRMSSNDDQVYEIGCRTLQNNTMVGYSQRLHGDDLKSFNLTRQLKMPKAPHSKDTEGTAFMKVYDLENEVYVETVKPRQLVQLQVTLTSTGNDPTKNMMYEGRMEACNATSSNGFVLPIVRNFCPVGFDELHRKYFIDGNFTIYYIPFRILPSLAGSEIDFSCLLSWYDVYPTSPTCGRRHSKQRPKRSSESLMKMRVSSQVQVLDRDHRAPRASGQGIVEEEIIPSSTLQVPKVDVTPRTTKIPMEYLVAGTSLIVGLFISVAVNVYLLIVIRRKFGNHDSNNEETASVIHAQPDTSFISRPGVVGRYDCLYDASSQYGDSHHQWSPLPQQQQQQHYHHHHHQGTNIGRSSSFRYGPDWNSPFTTSSRYEVQPETYTPSKWFGKTDNREILYPPMPIRQAQSTRRSHSFRY